MRRCRRACCTRSWRRFYSQAAGSARAYCRRHQLERGKVTFRSHPHRRLKSRTSHRTVPLWPQLREILTPYVAGLKDVGPGALLFPSVRGTGPVRDLRKALDAAAGRAGRRPGEIRTKMFRHTYCAARLQTATRVIRRDAVGQDLTQWIPVSRDEVAREMGHGGTSLVAKVYGHVGDTAHRSEEPEFRVEQHRKVLAPRVRLLDRAAA